LVAAGRAVLNENDGLQFFFCSLSAVIDLANWSASFSN